MTKFQFKQYFGKLGRSETGLKFLRQPKVQLTNSPLKVASGKYHDGDSCSLAVEKAANQTTNSKWRVL